MPQLILVKIKGSRWLRRAEEVTIFTYNRHQKTLTVHEDRDFVMRIGGGESAFIDKSLIISETKSGRNL